MAVRSCSVLQTTPLVSLASVPERLVTNTHPAQSAECRAAKDKGSEVRDARSSLCILLGIDIRLPQPSSTYRMVDRISCYTARQQPELQANGRYTVHQNQRFVLTPKKHT